MCGEGVRVLLRSLVFLFVQAVNALWFGPHKERGRGYCRECSGDAVTQAKNREW